MTIKKYLSESEVTERLKDLDADFEERASVKMGEGYNGVSTGTCILFVMLVLVIQTNIINNILSIWGHL